MMRLIRNRNRKRGTAALELALMLPLFLLLLIGILEFGRAVMIVQMGTSASREACRQAIIPGAKHDNIIAVANNYLDHARISESGRVVEIRNSEGNATNLSNIGPHETVTVHIAIPYDANTFGMSSWFFERTLVTEVSMRRE